MVISCYMLQIVFLYLICIDLPSFKGFLFSFISFHRAYPILGLGFPVRALRQSYNFAFLHRYVILSLPYKLLSLITKLAEAFLGYPREFVFFLHFFSHLSFIYISVVIFTAVALTILLELHPLWYHKVCVYLFKYLEVYCSEA